MGCNLDPTTPLLTESFRHRWPMSRDPFDPPIFLIVLTVILILTTLTFPIPDYSILHYFSLTCVILNFLVLCFISTSDIK